MPSLVVKLIIIIIIFVKGRPCQTSVMIHQTSDRTSKRGVKTTDAKSELYCQVLVNGQDHYMSVSRGSQRLGTLVHQRS